MGEEAIASTEMAGSGLAERARRAGRALLREAGAAFGRTPLEVLLGVCAAVGFSIAVQQEAMEDWSHLLVTVAIALPLTYAASVLAWRGALAAPVRWAVSGAAVVGAALYGYFMFDPQREAEAWRAWLLVGTAFSVLLCTPLFRPAAGDRREQEQRFIARFAVRVIIVGAYAGALFVGLALALAAINGLFELHMSGKAWAHLASALFILLPPWAVAAGLPALIAPLDTWKEGELRLLRLLGAILLVPLVLVYLAIVYAYTVRVLATGEVPKNLVSPVVIGAGLLIVVTILALEPVQRDREAGGLAFLLRLSSPLLFPLVVFAIWAVSTRVGQYGWTEFRYLRLLALLLLAAYAAAALYRLVRRRLPPLTVVPAVLAAVLLLAAVGPWSATAVAHRSQAGALRHYLALARRTGPGDPPTSVPPQVFRGITDKASYLRQHFGWGAMRESIPWIGEPPATTNGTRPGQPQRLDAGELARRIGIVEAVAPSMLRIVDAQAPPERGIPGIVAGTMFVFDVSGAPEKRPGQRGRVTPQRLPGQALVAVDRVPTRLDVIAPNGDTLVADVAPLMRALLQRSASETGQPIYDDRRRSDRGEQTETARELNLQLDPAAVLVPATTPDGRSGAQVVVRHIRFDASPRARGTAAGAARAPATAAANPLSADSLHIRSVSGFIILPPSGG